MDVLLSNKLREQRARLFEQEKQVIEAAKKEGRGFSTEETEKLAKMDADLEKFDADIAAAEKVEKRTLETATPADPDTREKGDGLGEKYAAAFDAYLRGGEKALNAEQRSILSAGKRDEKELRAQSVTTTGGGYAIPQGFVANLEKSRLAFGGMRQAASVFATDAGNDLPYPTMNDTSNTGELLAINTAAAAQDVTFGQIVFKAYKYSSKVVLVPSELMQDSAFDLNVELSAILGERLGRIENTHFTTGDNSGKPQGVVTGASSGVTAASASALTADEIIDLVHSVDPAYRVGPKVMFMFNDATLKLLRKLKDGNGQYLWQPGNQAGVASTLFGYQYIVNQDVASVGSSAKSVLFGDFSKYRIRDVRGITLKRLDERYAIEDQVAFLALMRTDGRVLDSGTDPIKYITQAA